MLNINSWTEIYDTRLQLPTIQAEYTREIGQLIYTNQFIDTIILQEYYKIKTQFEWDSDLNMLTRRTSRGEKGRRLPWFWRNRN